MKSFLTLVFLLSINFIFSQGFNLVELEKLNIKNWDDFDTYVINKGYLFYSSDKDDISEFREYSYTRNNNGKSSFWISKYTYADGSQMVSWQTNRQSDYIKIKNELKTLAYKFVESKVYNGKNVNVYRKGNRQLSLITGTAISSSGNEVNYAEISITID